MTLGVVCFLWGDKYTHEHVNKLYRGVKRNLDVPFNFFCFTDKSYSYFDEGVIPMPLWDKCRDLGGCYNRLYIFHEMWGRKLGDRFVCIDIDCVVVGDLTPLFTRKEDFVINSYQPMNNGRGAKDQIYNGAMFLMNAGARQQVWDRFSKRSSPEILKTIPDIVGTDQAWIRHILGRKEATWGAKDGVHEARNVYCSLPRKSRIVFFAGNRDPATCTFDWVKQHWI